MQGYIFSKPLPAQELEQLLGNRARLPDRYLRPATRQPTLLLVDADAEVLASLSQLLRSADYRIVHAGSGPEGLAKLAEHDVDVILSAQRLPGMTGVEFLRRAKALYPGTVRMILSGCNQDLQAIMDAAHDGTVQKFLANPWDDNLLREYVAEAFRHKDLAEENRRLSTAVCSAKLELAQAHERHQRQLAQQRERLALEATRAKAAQDVIEHLPTASIGIDPDGIIIFVNRQARRLLPSASTLVGHDASDALPPDGLNAWQRPDGHHRPGRFDGRLCMLSCTTMDDDGTLRGHLLSVIPMPDGAREVAA